jgi:hypothetical protein
LRFLNRLESSPEKPNQPVLPSTPKKNALAGPFLAMETAIGVILEAAFAVGISASMGKRLLLGKIPWLGVPTKIHVCHNRPH